VARGANATVAGGSRNVAFGNDATVGGGAGNAAQGTHATIDGGLGNQAAGIYASVGGGYGNAGSGAYSSIPGGAGNQAAGDYSVASGHRSTIHPAHGGVFLFADAHDFDFESETANEFAVRATGGVRMVTAIDGSGKPVSGVELATGSGSWSSLSALEVKENIATVDAVRILAQLGEVPISTWNYAGQEPSIRHIGPMAQDFYTAFGVGEAEEYIATVDADGVALAAIQGLYRLVQDKEAQIATQQQQITALEARVAALEQGIKAPSSPTYPLSLGISGGWWLFGLLLAAVTLRRRI
jgi:hypothetical protein